MYFNFLSQAKDIQQLTHKSDYYYIAAMLCHYYEHKIKV